MPDDFQKEFLAKFKEEADELIARLNQGLMALESDPTNSEWLREIARLAHTIKGTASMMGIDSISEMAHSMEDALVMVRDEELEMTAELGDVLFAGLDAIQIILNQLIGQQEEQTPNVAVLSKQIRRLLTSNQGNQATRPETPIAPEEQLAPIKSPGTRSKTPESLVEHAPEVNEFLGIFKTEANELLEILNRGALALEENPDDEAAIGELARAAHTLKGSAKMMGFDDISTVAHRLEDRLMSIRDGDEKMTPEVGDLLFSSLDAINALLEGGVLPPFEDTEHEPQTDIDTQTIVKTRKEVESEPGTAAPGTISDRGPLATAFGRAPTKHGPGTTDQPSPDSVGPLTLMEGSGIQLGQLMPKATSTPLATIMQETIRVDTGKVDALVNMAGEMVINQIRFEDGLKMFKRLWVANKELHQRWVFVRDAFMSMRDSGTELSDSLLETMNRYAEGRNELTAVLSSYSRHVADDTVHLSMMTGDLQHHVMALRMVPVASVFESFRRTIRDIAREMGKKVRAEIVGQETEIDKKMIEGIKDPLVHLVRNAIDHGIESPEERVRLGKPAEGTLKLAARGEGDHIIIEIEDDGRGMNPDSIRDSAIRKGVISSEEALRMSERDCLHLIFRPNFSTKGHVTEFSGRGVGMDVVKTNIDGLKGEVHIETELGIGSRFLLMLPLTLAVTRVLFVECGSNTFAIPTSSVLKTAKIRRSEIKSIERREAIQILDRTVPLANLSDVLFLRRNDSDDEKFSVIVLQYAGEYIGFIVDKVVGEQEIVVKELGVHLQDVPNLAGAAVLGSGNVVIVLHVPELFASSKQTPRVARTRVARAGPLASSKRRVLVVEDSLATRELERNIIAAQGYEVDVAANGLNALQLLTLNDYDLVVTDISMPKMDGFQMIARIKENRDLMHMPVIIVTSHDSTEERRKGLELGVEGYVVKTAFDQSGLLDTIQRLIGDA
ncbi:MAG: hybrid sensor histidine kinase/response regulator [Planctomycetota bacterium]|nr:hybrid sensor histidine kinase/response regulator [Planctomycetota bacterium]